MGLAKRARKRQKRRAFWWKLRAKSRLFSTEFLKSREYNLDLCGYPSKDEEILEPFALIEKYKNKQAKASQEISKILEQITDILKQNA